jgi:hypothetical protein
LFRRQNTPADADSLSAKQRRVLEKVHAVFMRKNNTS